MSIRFLHIRRMAGSAHGPLGKGGMTVAYEVAEFEPRVVRFSVAQCSPRDNYCRKTGRLIATGRLNAGKEYTARLVQNETPIEAILQEINNVIHASA